jgi:hypothetical protein
MAINRNTTSFWVMPLKHVLSVIDLVNITSFLVMPLKHVMSVMDFVNHSGTPKLWAIAHENAPKMLK